MNKKGLTDFFVISRFDCIQLHFFLIYRYCLHFKIVKSVAGFWFLTLVSICERKIRQRKNSSSTTKQWSSRKWSKITTNIRIDPKKIGNLSKGRFCVLFLVSKLFLFPFFPPYDWIFFCRNLSFYFTIWVQLEFSLEWTKMMMMKKKMTLKVYWVNVIW